MKQRKFRLQGAAVCAIVAVAGIVACGDDSTSPGGSDAAEMEAGNVLPLDGSSPDSAVHDATTSTEASSTPDASSDASSPPDASSPDASMPDASSDASPPPEASSLEASSAAEASAAQDSGDAAAPDADGAASPGQLQLCALWDTDFQLSESDASASQATYDRTQWWGYAIGLNFTFDLTNDCLISAMFNDVANMDPFMYSNEITTFTIPFMGCAGSSDAGAQTYGPITVDSMLAEHVFSTADIALLSAHYVTAVTETLQCGGPCPPNDGTLGPANDTPNFPTMPALTEEQLSGIQAKINALGATFSNKVTSSTYTYNSCPADAGLDAPDDGG